MGEDNNGPGKGRTTKYTKALADKICERLAQGESLRRICADESFPHESTVRNWAVENRNGFFTQYARARDIGLDAMAEETLDIADDGQNDWMESFNSEGESIGWKLNHEHVQRSRLRIDARKWYLSKMAPKRYGDKPDPVETKDEEISDDYTEALKIDEDAPDKPQL